MTLYVHSLISFFSNVAIDRFGTFIFTFHILFRMQQVTLVSTTLIKLNKSTTICIYLCISALPIMYKQNESTINGSIIISKVCSFEKISHV